MNGTDSQYCLPDALGSYLSNAPAALDEFGEPGYVLRKGFNIQEVQRALRNGPVLANITVGDQAHTLVIDSIDNGMVSIRDPAPDLFGSAYKVSLPAFLASFRNLLVLRP